MRGKNIIRYNTQAASVFLAFVVYLLVVAISPTHYATGHRDINSTAEFSLNHRIE
jgi:hypothetical protein